MFPEKTFVRRRRRWADIRDGGHAQNGSPVTQPKGRRRRAKVRGLGKGEGESADAGPNLWKPKKKAEPGRRRSEARANENGTHEHGHPKACHRDPCKPSRLNIHRRGREGARAQKPSWIFRDNVSRRGHYGAQWHLRFSKHKGARQKRMRELPKSRRNFPETGRNFTRTHETNFTRALGKPVHPAGQSAISFFNSKRVRRPAGRGSRDQTDSDCVWTFRDPGNDSCVSQPSTRRVTDRPQQP